MQLKSLPHVHNYFNYYALNHAYNTTFTLLFITYFSEITAKIQLGTHDIWKITNSNYCTLPTFFSNSFPLFSASFCRLSRFRFLLTSINLFSFLLFLASSNYENMIILIITESFRSKNENENNSNFLDCY